MGPIQEIDMVIQLLFYLDEHDGDLRLLHLFFCLTKLFFLHPVEREKKSYSMDCYFRQAWKDSRLAYDPESFQGKPKNLALSVNMLDKIWVSYAAKFGLYRSVERVYVDYIFIFPNPLFRSRIPSFTTERRHTFTRSRIQTSYSGSLLMEWSYTVPGKKVRRFSPSVRTLFALIVKTDFFHSFRFLKYHLPQT